MKTLVKKPTIPEVYRFDPQNEFFPILVGRELLFGISAQQTAATYPHSKQAVKHLLRIGKLCGTEEQWSVAPSVWSAIVQNLDIRAQKGPPAVLTLVKAFRRARTGKLFECHTADKSRDFVFFRHLSRKVDPEVILNSIEPFFHVQAQSENPDPSLQNFGKYITKQITAVGKIAKTQKRKVVQKPTRVVNPYA